MSSKPVTYEKSQLHELEIYHPVMEEAFQALEVQTKNTFWYNLWKASNIWKSENLNDKVPWIYLNNITKTKEN